MLEELECMRLARTELATQNEAMRLTVLVDARFERAESRIERTKYVSRFEAQGINCVAIGDAGTKRLDCSLGGE